MIRLHKTVAIIAVVLFALGMSCGTMFLRTKLRRCPHYVRGLYHRFVLHRDVADQNTQFRWFMSATAKSPRGSYIDLSIYQSPDCVEICTGYAKLSSPGEAEAEFEQALAGADRVYERTKQTTTGGTVTQERAVAQLGRGEYLILLRNGNEIRRVSSESLSYASEFERRGLKPR